jgi:3-deoxy-D-manno-octulosonate 8-phosphate phosphatase KdsC-like HAD superfamily phosphatase
MDSNDTDFVKKYCVRFGVIAVKKGYINEDNLFEALKLQVEEDLNSEEHRLIGAILYDLGMMSEKEIEDVVNELLKEQEENL